eukprot:2188686-Amphidinium_carterae.2
MPKLAAFSSFVPKDAIVLCYGQLKRALLPATQRISQCKVQCTTSSSACLSTNGNHGHCTHNQTNSGGPEC